MTIAPAAELDQTDSVIDPAFEALLDYLKHSRGFDFTGYKHASLIRRIDKEMQAVGIGTYDDYRDYLEVHPEEFARLFNTILINVTTFFRDAPTWEYLSEEIVPRMIAAKTAGEPIRLWSAGCASGQEPYSLAMAFAEKLGVSEFRERVKIYATDVDEEALAQARAASFTARDVHGISPLLLEKYFEPSDGHFVFRQDMRRALIFGRHDLLQDAPISRIDLLACRNTLMYFNSEAQAKILGRFHFALNDGGCLLLGKAEMLFSHAGFFAPLDLKRRAFAKIPKSGRPDRRLLMAQADADSPETPPSVSLRLRDAVFHAGQAAQLVVDRDGTLAMANERARALFRLGNRSVGQPLQDLEISYRPIELRSCIEQAYAEGRSVSIKEVSWTPPGGKELMYLDALIVPLQDEGEMLGAGIAFHDATPTRRLSEELQATHRKLETAYEELQSTIEELETTNEELQSTVEELETTNEELQSTNEELETTNEELQSTNEELHTINEELRARSGELNKVNAFLESILTSLRGGVIVLDRDLNVQIWNSKSQELWGLRAGEVQGKSFLTLDIGLPVDDLLPAIRACLSDRRDYQTVTVTARNRRGKTIQGRVIITPLIGVNDDLHGIILLVEET